VIKHFERKGSIDHNMILRVSMTKKKKTI